MPNDGSNEASNKAKICLEEHLDTLAVCMKRFDIDVAELKVVADDLILNYFLEMTLLELHRVRDERLRLLKKLSNDDPTTKSDEA